MIGSSSLYEAVFGSLGAILATAAGSRARAAVDCCSTDFQFSISWHLVDEKRESEKAPQAFT